MDTYSFILEILEFVVDGISSCFTKIGETAIAQGILHCISTALWFPNQGNGFGYLSWKTANDQVQDLFLSIILSIIITKGGRKRHTQNAILA